MNNNRMLRNSGTALMIAASLSIAACSSSSGGSDSDPARAAVASGVASKGIVRDASVTVTELDINGNARRTVGTATTDEHGRYTLQVGNGYTGGPLLFRLEPDANSRMICDLPAGCGTANFGDPVEIDDGFEMLAIAPSVATNDTVSVQITPFTTMATRRVLNGSQIIDDAAIRQAVSEVSDMLGLDVLGTEPADLSRGSDDDDAKTYGAFLVGVAALAASGDLSLPELLSALGAAFEDGRFDSDDAIDMREFVAAIEDAALALFPEGDTPSKLLAAIANLYDKIEDDGSYDPKPDEDAAKPAIAKAKALLVAVRERWNTLEALEDPLNDFVQEAEAAESTFSRNGARLLSTAESVLSDVFATVYDDDDGVQMGDHAVEVVSSDGSRLGTVNVTVSESRNGTFFDMERAVLNNGIELELDLATDLRASEVEGWLPFFVDGVSFDLTGIVEDGTTRVEITNGELDAQLRDRILYEPNTGMPVGSAVLDVVTFGGQTTLEDRASGLSFQGDLKVRGDVRLAANEDPEPDNLKRLYLNAAGVFSSPSDAFRARLIVDGTNGSEFVVGSLSLSIGLDFAGEPDTNAALSLRRVDADSLKAELTFSDPKKRWSLATQLREGEDISHLTISNPSGVLIRLALTGDDDINGDILVDGKKVADIKEMRDRLPTIYWIDGRFESLL